MSDNSFGIGLVGKLVAATLAVVFLTVGTMVVATQWTFQAGFTDYLARAEAQRLQPLVERLARYHAEAGGWDYLRGRPHVWDNLLRETLNEGSGFGYPPGPPTGRPPPRWESAKGPPERPNGVGRRLHLMASDGTPLVGPAQLPSDAPGFQRVPVEVNGREVGYLRLMAAPLATDGLDREFRRDQVRALYLIAAAAGVFALLIALPLGRHFLFPIRRLAAGARALAAGDYGTRLTISRKDELGRLADDFNHLAEVLERTERLRREGMANVSHELRTPLATLKAEVEAMQDGIRPLDARQLESLGGTVEQMNRLVDDLYQLALADVGALVYRKIWIELDSLVEESTRAARTALAERGLALMIDVEPGILVEGDPIRLRQLLDNLLQNSRRYTDAGGSVTVALRRHGDAVELEVADSAPGVDGAVLPHLFDRFYRVESSRNRATGGAGLGLALVKAIAEAHGGRVWTRPAPLGGVAVSVRLPMSQEGGG